jgi:hypothetical protein
MLTLYRRHLASCEHKDKGRQFKRCWNCPIWDWGHIGEDTGGSGARSKAGPRGGPPATGGQERPSRGASGEGAVDLTALVVDGDPENIGRPHREGTGGPSQASHLNHTSHLGIA